MVILFGWLMLFCWTVTLWLRFGFDYASQRLYQLSNQQHTAIVQLNNPSITERLNAVLTKLPMVSLSSKVSDMNRSIHRALPKNQLTEINRVMTDALCVAKQIWQFIAMTSQVMLIKLTILIVALPLFLLSMTAGLVDGLNQRAIRTASLGRESSYVFHQMNRLFKRGFIVLLGLWLAIPVSITPALMLVPVSVLLSVMTSMTTSRFKKYL